MEVDSISPTEINQFFSCPRKWYYYKTARVGVVVDDSALFFGKLIHDSIAKFYAKIPPNPTFKEISDTAKETFGENRRYVYSGFGARFDRQMNIFIEFEKKRKRTWKQYKPTFFEKRLVAKPWKDIPEIHGIVDFYSKSDETVIDWKTPAQVGSDSTARQGKIYEILLRLNGYPVKKTVFFSLESGVNIQAPRVTDGWIYKQARIMVDMIRANRFPKKPSPLCRGWCEYVLDCQNDKRCIWMEV